MKYLGVPKNSGGGILFSYKRLEESFFFYEVIEKTKLYFSMLFDHTSEMQPVPVTGRSGLVPVWISDRPVAGRPARVLTLKFCFFHVKICKTSVGSQDYLPDNI